MIGIRCFRKSLNNIIINSRYFICHKPFLNRLASKVLLIALAMRPFRLEPADPPPLHSRTPRVIFTKNTYSEGIKYARWQEILEHKPIDVDPLCCQGKVNQFISHYKRLGTYDEKCYDTATGDMFKNVFVKERPDPNKPMNNYYTYNDNAECLLIYPRGQCPTVCADNYLSTMQHSYQMPHPYIMSRVSFQKIPYMQNRKYRHDDDPRYSCKKFFGEDFDIRTKELQKHKGCRWISFNPFTSNYTNAEEISMN